MNIIMKNQPRASGKTTTLKLMITEQLLGNSKASLKILALSPYRHQLVSLVQWSKELDFKIYTSTDQLRGTRDADIRVFIDEPFSFTTREQEEIAYEANILSQRNDVTIHGIGTLVKENKPLFERYL